MKQSTAIDRRLYQNNVYDPYGYEELSFIAHKHNFSKAVIWSSQGEYKLRPNFFDKYFYDPIRKKCSNNESVKTCLDSIILNLNKRYYDLKVNEEGLEDVQDSKNRPRRVFSANTELTTWEKIFGKEEKLFDTQEWKEYIKKKSKSDE